MASTLKGLAQLALAVLLLRGLHFGVRRPPVRKDVRRRLADAACVEERVFVSLDLACGAPTVISR